MQSSDAKKTPGQTVGTGGVDLPGEGKDDLIIMQISDEVKTYLIETYNFLKGTEETWETLEYWRLYSIFRIPSDCPYIFRNEKPEDEGGMSLIQRMRKRALAGELPTSEPRRDTGSEKEGGEGKNTTGSKKTYLKPGTDVSHVEIDGVELDKNAVEGKWNMDYSKMIEDCKATCDKYTYTEVDRKDGKIIRHKGRVWRGTLYNTRLAKSIISRYNQWKPLMREAYLVTVTPYKDNLTAEHVEKLRELSHKVNRFTKRIRESERALVFRAYEWTEGAGIHAHLIVATCEDRKGFEDAVYKNLTRAGLHLCVFVEPWKVSDEPYYLTKTCLPSVDKIAEGFGAYAEGAKKQAFEAWMVWHCCRLAEVNQFAYPRTDPMKEERLPGEKLKEAGNDCESGVWVDPWTKASRAECREKAVETFKNTECSRCNRYCGIAEWLRKYVFGDNSIPYKTLGQFIKDGYE